MRRSRQSRGFTLVEVLVAMFVVALGMGALMATLTSAADATAQLREKSFAEWVALNRVSEVRLKGTVPATGKSDGEVEFAGGTWRWQMEITDPKIAGILRIDVSVSNAADSTGAAIATATGFYGTTIAPPSGFLPDWSSAPATGPAPTPPRVNPDSTR
ncbi:MAG: hypothetical protein RLZZ200_1253 [Pseudomonadota bacterium]|jgi:general secretion pathway protein I